MNGTPTIVHVTHETTQKIGGIGAVLKGFFTSQSYLNFAKRSIIVGPLFDKQSSVSKRLGEGGHVLYSFWDGLSNTRYAPSFQEIERIYNAGIVYGTKTFIDEQSGIESSQEVILVDVTHMHKEPVDEVKKLLFEKFGIQSDRHEHIWEFEQYLRLAPVVISILKAIDAADDSTIIVGHEWMGMPTVLAALSDAYTNFKTVFYAHEVATIRRIVEERPERDIGFYRELKLAQSQGKYLKEVFGDQSDYFKHQLIEASQNCHRVLAVGDFAASELRFLNPGFKNAAIDVVYNGIGAYKTTVQEKIASKAKLQQYCENLLGYKPDFIITHVTRLVKSKGLWRDIGILENIERKLQQNGQSAVLFVVSTETSKRDPESIRFMESAYAWPVAHREGWPDLSGGEADFYTLVQKFNTRSRHAKALLINQFGFDKKSCGENMPDDIRLVDLRRGTDVELGLSTYEPFGISHIEPLTYGGLCVISSICGCAGFINRVTSQQPPENIIIADYIESQNHTKLDDAALTEIEKNVNEQLGEKISSRLLNIDTEKMIQSGYSIAQKMSWDAVVSNYVLPNIQAILQMEKIEIPSRLD
ncbi:MAG: hypothetical protein WCZ89_06655 [Phycisphaerae bacterium]